MSMIRASAPARLADHADGRPRGGRTAAWVGETYYRYPPLKPPIFKWLVVGYFLVGGIAGAGFAIGAAADLFGRGEDRQVTRLGRYLGLILAAAGALMLIKDLKRPERFQNMLRIVKVRSPMSLGAWILLFFGLVAGLASALQLGEDLMAGRPRRGLLLTGKLVSAPGAVLGFLLSTYTGVLLSATAVPLWSKARWTLAPTFLATSVSTAAASLSLLLALAPRPAAGTLARLRRIHTVALATELALAAASRLERPELERPLTRGRWGVVYGLGAIGGGMVVPLALDLAAAIRPGAARAVAALSAPLTLAGGFCLRAAWVFGGIRAAAEPEAYFDWTRADGG